MLNSATPAQADITLDHAMTIRMGTGKGAVIKGRMFTSYTAQRARVLMKMDNPGFPIPGMPGGGKGDLNFALIHRLDDNHLVGYCSPVKQFVDEPMPALMEKLKFDPWKMLAPELGRVEPPAFTDEQRRRLGAEMRALTAPLLKKVWRLYFRQLSHTRTFEGVPTRGYRLTSLVNAGAARRGQEMWVRSATEWWLADAQPGDEVIKEYQDKFLETWKAHPFRTRSMWLNETFPILWHSLPLPLHEAWASLTPATNSPRFPGTPYRVYHTVKMPPVQHMMMGDIREEIVLRERLTKDLPDAVFSAPAGYKKMELDKNIKEMEEALKGPATYLNQMNEDLGFTWPAWHEYQRASRRLATTLVLQ